MYKHKNGYKKKRKLRIRISLTGYNQRGSTSTGNSFILVFVIILITMGVIFVGGVSPEATPPQTAPGKLTYKAKPPVKSPAQNTLQMYTFSGTASTPMPGPTKAPTAAPCIPAGGAAGGAGGGTAATGPICHPPGMPTKLVFNGDFETGNLTQWSSCQTKFDNGSCGNGSGYAITLVPDARQGKFAAKFELHDGDTVANGERTEVVSEAKGPVASEGDEYWYTWSEKFDATFRNPTGWFIILQWHDQSNGSPPVAVEVTENGDIEVSHGGTGKNAHKLGTIHKGVWTDYTLHIKFSGSNGFVEGWENCVPTMPKYSAKTLGAGSTYLKEGIYRHQGSGFPAIVYADGMTVTGN
jgi:hypothetical protein